MLFTERRRNILFRLSAIIFCLVMMFHLVGIFYPINETSVWRHILFAVVNLFCVYGTLNRPKYFVYLVALLLVQQYFSHGTYVVNKWVEEKQIHWISAFDLLLLPIVFICLIEDDKARK
jgi:hypothetical protein